MKVDAFFCILAAIVGVFVGIGMTYLAASNSSTEFAKVEIKRELNKYRMFMIKCAYSKDSETWKNCDEMYDGLTE